MAYRFLLEVPQPLAAEANIAVAGADDAQVLVVRTSHARPLDEPYVDLTVAAQSLRVISTLTTWFQQLGEPRPDIRLVLHSGDRLPLDQHDEGSLVASVRRDQSWVEHTIPKIGDHAEETFAPRTQEAQLTPATTASASPAASTAALERTWSTLPAIEGPASGRGVAIRDLNHLAIRVADLERAERFYTIFLGMEVVGRARRIAGGALEALPPVFDWDEVVRGGEEPDVTFLRNGPLVLALHRQGRGARIERGALDHISIRVDATTFTALKGQVLMQSMELLESAETAFAFRDPFSVTWEIALQSVPDFL